MRGLHAGRETAGPLRATAGKVDPSTDPNFEGDDTLTDFVIDTNADGKEDFDVEFGLDEDGDLYADVTTGYGPECFTVRAPAGSRPAYRLEAHYYSRGPMGYGMGKLEIIDHDGKGGLSFDERPFVIMQDRAYVALGSYPPASADKAAAAR